MIGTMPPVPRDEKQRVQWLEQLIVALLEELNEKQRQLDDHESRLAAGGL